MMPQRFVLVGATFLASVLLYIDRACISTAKDAIVQELSLTDKQWGWVMSAFAFGYALLQTPTGMWADRSGPRCVLTSVVVLWSLFTGLTTMAWSFVSLLAIRFLFGAGEAGAFPGMARAVFSWIPAEERGLVKGINFSGGRIGAAVTLPILPWMIPLLGWKMSFWLLTAVGFAWALFWFWWFRDDPAQQGRVSSSELELILGTRPYASARRAAPTPPWLGQRPATAHSDTAHSDTALSDTAHSDTALSDTAHSDTAHSDTAHSDTAHSDTALSDTQQQHQHQERSSAAHTRPPVAQMLGSGNFWCVMLQYFCSNFTFFFCLTWLYPYVKRTYQLEAVSAGVYAMAPLVAGAVGNIFSGWLVDRLYRSGHWTLSRRLPATVGFLLAAIGLAASVRQDTPLGATVWLAVAIFGADMTLAPSWSVCIDIGGTHSGAVSGTMNMAGNLGSALTGVAFPYLVAWAQDHHVGQTGYELFFYTGAALNLLGVILWQVITPCVTERLRVG